MNCLCKLSLGLLFLQVIACRQSSSENIRGKNQQPALNEGGPSAQEGSIDSSGDATVGKGSDTVSSNQQAVVVDSGTIPPLKLMAEADQTALPVGFMEDIFAIHKISDTKTLLYGKSKQSWLLDDGKQGVLTKLSVDISPPTETKLYVLEDKKFWLIGKSSVAFPSATPSVDPGQITLINLTPELLKDPANTNRILFAGPARLIIANEKRANIIALDGDKARVIALDFPKTGDVPLPVSTAGLMEGADAYWFLSTDRILLLRKGSDSQWRWYISKFKLDAQGVPPDAILDQVAMLIKQGEDKGVTFIGRTFELNAGKLYEQNPIKLSIDGAVNPPPDPAFVNTIQPLLTSACTPCHAGYEEFGTVKAKATVYRQMIADGTMPRGTALTPEQIKLLTDYLTTLITP